MKYTITLLEYITGQLGQKQCYNEFYNSNQLTYNDEAFQTIKKVMDYDSDVDSIVTHYLFRDLTLDTPAHDKFFKQMYINKFMNRQIGRQTIEFFASQNVTTFMQQQQYINFMLNHFDDLFSGGRVETIDTTNNANRTANEQTTSNAQSNTGTATLPQDEVNLDLTKTTMDYADVNSISLGKDNINISETDTLQDAFHSQDRIDNYDVDTFKKCQDLLEKVLLKFDKACFLQVW